MNEKTTHTEPQSPELDFIKSKFKEWTDRGYITRDLKNEADKSNDVPLKLSGINSYLNGNIKNINKATKLFIFVDNHITNFKKSLILTRN